MNLVNSIIISCVLSVSFSPTLLYAQPAKVNQDEWRFQVTPYVWLANLDGKVRPFNKAPKVHIKRSRSDILKNLDGAAFLMATARKNDFVIQTDITYASVSNKENLPFGLSAKAKIKQKTLSLVAGKRVSPTPEASLDLLAGARYWEIDAQVSVDPLHLHRRSTSQFIDPILAARYKYELTPALTVIGYGDIGGFGVGSKLSWQAFGSVNYALTNNIYVSAGYRHMAVNYRKSGRHLDFNMSGPMMGLSYQF